MNIADRIRAALPDIGNVVTMLLILGLLGLLLFRMPELESEIQMGLVVVMAIAALLTLMTVMSAVFSKFGLATPNQALGLPEGSIRALIALFLIIIFIIMSVYLFRTIAGGEGARVNNLTLTEVSELGDQIFSIKPNEAGSFDVTLRSSVTAASEQLALQLVTILGTLVTAVSAFYFGSSSTASVAARAASSERQNVLSIRAVMPSSADASATPLSLEITGSGFVAGAGVKLSKSGETDIEAASVSVSNGTKLTCTLDLNNRPSGQWDIIVTNPDKNSVVKAGLFQIKG